MRLGIGLMVVAEDLRAEDPARLGDYWLAGRLGTGGQGVVYEAYDDQGRRVAIKVLHGYASADPELKHRFGREVTAGRRVASFCTARVLAAHLDGPRPYIVSEYVEGPSLRQAVRDGRVFAGDDLHRLATAIATALTAIHEAGVIHRDLKPDNVLLGPDGPRVIDFGVARTLEMSLTSTGRVAGTPTYMAPEVFTGRRAGPPSDVFAWGGIVLFAATGDDPFRAESLGGVMHRVLSVDPDLTALPEALRPLVAKALAKDPLDRPAARDLLLSLVGGAGLDTGGLLAEGSRAAGTVGASAGAAPLGTLAEDAYRMLSRPERDVAVQIFLRMVAVDPHGELTTQAVPEDDLPAGAGPVLDAFSSVLSRRDGEVFARPALLGAWPRLRSWAAGERDGLTAHAAIRAQARQWEGHGRRDGDLLHGSRLEAAVAWAATGRRRLVLNPLERALLEASAALSRQRARRRRLLTTALAALLVLALAGGALSVHQSGRIADQRDRASGRELAYLSGALRTSDPVTAMLLGVAGWRLAPGADTRSGLMSALQQPEIAAFAEPPVKELSVRALSRDGRVLVSASASGVRLYDVRAGRLIRTVATPSLAGQIPRDVALSPSGRLVAILTDAATLVLDAHTGQKQAERHSDGARVGGGLEFGADESKLAFLEDGDAFVWDHVAGRVYGHHEDSDGEVTVPAVSPSGNLAAMPKGRGTLEVWRMPEGTRDPRFRDACPGVLLAAFSPDGKTLACAARSISLLPAEATGRLPGWEDRPWLPWPELGTSEQGPAAGRGLVFTADGRFLVGFADRGLHVWQVATERQIFTHQAEEQVSDARLDPDGHTLRYLMDDTVVSLDIRPQVTSARVPGTPSSEALTPDGRWLVVKDTGRQDEEIRLWDVRRGRIAADLGTTARWGDPLALDPGGRTLVTTRQTSLGTARVGQTTLCAWDIATRASLWTQPLPADYSVDGHAFSPDGATLAVALAGPPGQEEDPRLLRLDARTGRLLGTVRLEAGTGDMRFTPDGRMIATAAGRLIDAETGRQIGPAVGRLGTNAVALSPSGSLLAVSGEDGRIALWDTRGREPSPVPPVLHGDTGIIQLMAFSPTGDVLATSGAEVSAEGGTVQFWDVKEKRRLGDPVTLHNAILTAMAFDQDGADLILVTQDGTIYRLPAGGDQVARAVCARAGRTLKEPEWRRHLPGVPYRDVCAR
ncbi:protein kinase [Microbispora sp. NPDC049125]|uniref:protein kinase domain-containing protein n=1 Tax=Microbispora sp. NPDC049125 TaxID=3154929 RepID=UPI0034664CE7